MQDIHCFIGLGRSTQCQTVPKYCLQPARTIARYADLRAEATAAGQVTASAAAWPGGCGDRMNFRNFSRPAHRAGGQHQTKNEANDANTAGDADDADDANMQNFVRGRCASPLRRVGPDGQIVGVRGPWAASRLDAWPFMNT